MTTQKVFNVDQVWYEFIVDKTKKIEGRLRKGKVNDLVIGEKILIADNETNNCIEVMVTKIVKYDSFETMLMMEGVNRVLPNKEWISDGIDVYRQFYSKEDEKKFGVTAIHFDY
jgi:ASC-1-like (ASCH) protein